MSVKINFTDQENKDTLKINVTPSNKPLPIEIIEQEDVSFKLKLRSAINGDLIILDHKDIDIVIQPGNKKVVTFAKEVMNDAVYGAESRLLEFLRKKGVINYDSIQGGNVYGSLEGTLMESGKIDAVKATLLNISEWMETERPYMQGTSAYEQMEDDALIDPENADSTDLGEIPQAADKGSISQRTIFAPYMYGRFAI